MNCIYKLAFFLLFTTSLAAKLNAQIVNIPDANFKAALLAHFVVINTNGDGEIQVSEAQAFTGTLAISGKNIVDLSGIEAFISIKTLWCYDNQITTIDLTTNTALTELVCYNNQLTTLNLINNTALKRLICNENQLTSLDVTNNTALNQLDCSENQLTSLDVTNNMAVYSLGCSSNQLTSLDVTNNMDLASLYCGWNQLTTLNVTNNTALNRLHCNDNQLTSLDVTNNTAVYSLICSSNQLTSLDLSTNTVLTELICSFNQLTSLNLTTNTALGSLSCSNNKLTSLDLTANTALTYLYCHYNQLTSLNLTANVALTTLHCNNNQLTSLDLRNGNNTTISSFSMKLTSNSNLSCISVDDPAWSAANWTSKDTQTQFSSNCACGVFSIDIDSVRNVSCLDLGYAIASVSGGFSPFQYEWLNAPLSSDSILIADTAGLYVLKVTDVNQCESFRKIILSAPKVKTGFELNSNLHVGVFRPGRLTTVDLSTWNDGCLIENALLKLSYNGPLNFESSVIPPTSQSGDTLSWDLGTMEYAISDFLTSLQFRIDTLAQAGDRVCFEVLITPLSGDMDSTNNLKSYCFDVVNSYDPNDKQVYPQGVCAENYTLKNEPLTYTIRFQNTGNAPAIDVYLIDSLSPYLNIYSLRVLSSSHEGLISEVLGDDILKFNFQNINLADSLSDEAGSKGFVVYQIEPYPGLNEGTVIENSAGIYFDFNPPVITNTTRNTLVSVLPQIAASTITETVCGSYMAPNHDIYTSSGIYTAVVKNAFGCDSLIHYQLTINKVDTSVSIIYPVITANASGAVYQWLDCDNNLNPISGATNQYYSVSQDGIYAVSITQNGCTDTSACTVMNLGTLNNLIDNSDMLLHPNPTTGKFQIDFGKTNTVQYLQITDLNGRIIRQVNTAGKQNMELELQEAAGLYLVHIFSKTQELKVLRLVKE